MMAGQSYEYMNLKFSVEAEDGKEQQNVDEGFFATSDIDEDKLEEIKKHQQWEILNEMVSTISCSVFISEFQGKISRLPRKHQQANELTLHSVALGLLL